MPKFVTIGQARDIVLKYLHEHPGSRHYSASREAAISLELAFPVQFKQGTTAGRDDLPKIMNGLSLALEKSGPLRSGPR